MKSSLFYLVLGLGICLCVIWGKFSGKKDDFLVFENFLFILYILFLIVGILKAYNYRFLIN
jgi:hypothetical protein